MRIVTALLSMGRLFLWAYIGTLRTACPLGVHLRLVTELDVPLASLPLASAGRVLPPTGKAPADEYG